MCDPTMAAAGLYTAGMLSRAAASARQGESAYQAARFNAAMLENERRASNARRRKELADLNRQGDIGLGQTRAGFGASGVQAGAGSPLDVLLDAQDRISRDAGDLLDEWDEADTDYRNRINWTLYQGKNARYAGRTEAGMSLLTAPLRWLGSSGKGW